MQLEKLETTSCKNLDTMILEHENAALVRQLHEAKAQLLKQVKQHKVEVNEISRKLKQATIAEHQLQFAMQRIKRLENDTELKQLRVNFTDLNRKLSESEIRAERVEMISKILNIKLKRLQAEHSVLLVNASTSTRDTLIEPN